MQVVVEQTIFMKLNICALMFISRSLSCLDSMCQSDEGAVTRTNSGLLPPLGKEATETPVNPAPSLMHGYSRSSH